MPPPDDRTQRLLAALDALSDQLPALLRDQWPAFEERLTAYLNRLQREMTLGIGRPAITAALILRFLQEFPAIYPSIQALMQGGSPQEYRERMRSAGEVLERLQMPQPVTRYVDVVCPRCVHVGGGRFAVTVKLTVRPNPQSVADAEPLTLRADTPVHIYAEASGLVLTNGNHRTLTLPAEGDSAAVAFEVQPLCVGDGRLDFHFLQEDQPIGDARVDVEIVAAETPLVMAGRQRLSGLVQFEAGLPAPDLAIYVAYETPQGTPQLRLSVFEGERMLASFPPVGLQQVAERYTAWLYQQFNFLAGEATAMARPPDEAVRADERMREAGRLLWEDLLHGEFKALLREEWANWRGRTLLLISDEPEIPWEMIWPNVAEPGYDDPFCTHFRFSRWLRPAPQDEKPHWMIGRLHWRRWLSLIPSATELSFAQAEKEHLRHLLSRTGAENLSPAAPTEDAVRRALRHPFQWLHVAAHGFTGPDNLGDSAAVALDDWAFKPAHFVPAEVRQRMGRERPGVFFNTCHGGRQQWSVTGLGGWARRILAAGAGLFLSPQWTVTDEGAYTFAATLYAQLEREVPAAEAVHAARLAARSRQGDPTWLAYALYAHPHARVM
ncbi:MAG: CHAT domain-containing protein [Caldilineaceae bacterium]|nr:CHAT domain-containing protein [Caldilineaceae bacterium]